MTFRRFLSLMALAGLAVGASACSSDSKSPETLAPTSVLDSTTSTSVADATTSSSSSTSTSSTTSSSSTSSTIAVVKGLDMSAEGLGNALFGAEADGVLDYVKGILGKPTDDTGWQDPAALGAPCPGTRIRFVSWNDLSIQFSDDSPAASGFDHFASYSYGPPRTGTVDPFGVTTAKGIGIGSTVAELRAAYPEATVSVADDISGPSFFIQEGFSGFLTGTTDADAIISFVGGYGCGE